MELSEVEAGSRISRQFRCVHPTQFVKPSPSTGDSNQFVVRVKSKVVIVKGEEGEESEKVVRNGGKKQATGGGRMRLVE